MAGEDVEAEGAGQVGDHRLCHRLHRRSHIGDGSVWGGDHQQVDAAGGTRQIVAPAERNLDPPPGRRQRTAEGEAGPARADDA
jgi:hypothetical protein